MIPPPRLAIARLALLVCGLATGARGQSIVVDSFDEVSGWKPYPADGVELSIGGDSTGDGHALRLDFNFRKGGGYAVAHKALDLELPENYAFTFRIRGNAPVNHLEFKLIDASGENVWWSVRRDAHFPSAWETWSIKHRQISFAWGPQGGGELRHVAAIEFAITAGSGGQGTVWLDQLELKPLAIPSATPPTLIARGSTEADEHPAQLAVDGSDSTYWSPGRDEPSPTLVLDLGESREFGGLSIDWVAGRSASDYRVEASDDGAGWRLLRHVVGSNGGRDDLYLPDSEARQVRIRGLGSGAGGRSGAAIAEIRVRPLEWSATREAFYLARAKEAPRGLYPRGISGEQSLWTVVGQDRDPREVLFSSDGALETGKAAFSLEPFLYFRDHLVTWNDVEISQSLAEGSLPIPTVTWRTKELELAITAFAIGDSGSSSVVARYRLKNLGRRRATASLFLALRPFQANPPSQFLNTRGGWAPLRVISREARTLRVNEEQAVLSLSSPSGFGATTFDGGDVVADYLRFGRLPQQGTVRDSTECASAALAYALDLPARGSREVDLLVPLYERDAVDALAPDAAPAWVEARLTEAAAAWRARCDRVQITLPREFAPVTESIQAQLAYVLINRAGAAIQPGTRAYARSWIRDGALTSSALLRLGQNEAVRDFIAWFAPYQYDNGKIPCCVDQRGSDPVPENDSGGEFIFLVAEYLRYSGDRAFVEKYWPAVDHAAAYLVSLRQLRRTDEYRASEKLQYFGLLPPSISHEGYSAKPMHSYWDDLFALRGFRDAAYLAAALGKEESRVRWDAAHREFEADLLASYEAAMSRHGIDYLPGCADLGDFDATSTTIALSPVQAPLPRAALERTFQKYYDFFVARRDGGAWEAYTPYEIRNIGAFIHLGWRERAWELTQYFLAAQYPPGWRQWSEVVWHDTTTPHFLGDIPHTWVGSDFIRSMLDALAYVREADDALVVAAGVPEAWLVAPGVRVSSLPTPYGKLTYSLHSSGSKVILQVDAPTTVPPGGIVLRPPVASGSQASVNGKTLPKTEQGEWLLRAIPARVTFERPR